MPDLMKVIADHTPTIAIPAVEAIVQRLPSNAPVVKNCGCAERKKRLLDAYDERRSIPPPSRPPTFAVTERGHTIERDEI